jgi:hypothetical protein
MKTIQLSVEDNVYQDILKSGIDIQCELKAIYKKEHKIANELAISLNDVAKGKTKPLQDLLDEI